MMERPINSYRSTPDLMAPCDIAAIVLAGGRGERLGPLTADCAKPAVPFGSGYRIIDFSLANCRNSGIHRVGVATQYQAHSVANHIRRQWNLPRRTRYGIDLWDATCVAPGGRYTGTADAVFRNLANLRTHRPRLLLVLAGDHVYQMDYRSMIDAHLASGAMATVACIEVPLADASRYGVLATDSRLRVVSFAEKPERPIPTAGRADRALVSMGIYLFDFETIARQLLIDALTPGSTHDFGRDVLPRLIAGHQVHAYSFLDAQGQPRFWRDVGTPDAYHAASMALLDPGSGLQPAEGTWQVPAEVRSAGTIVEGITRRSVLAEGVVVQRGAHLRDCVVLPGAQIGERASLQNAIVTAGCRVPPDTRIGIEGATDTLPCARTASGIRIITPEAVDRAARTSARAVVDRNRPRSAVH